MTRLGPAGHTLRRDVRTCLADLEPASLTLVACSGGPDSLTLAAVTAHLGRPAGAVVVDHGLQPDSGTVAADAARICRELGLDPVTVVPVSVPPGAGGPEAAARAARYDALQRTAASLGATAVLLGHTLDDQAESVLLGLARGSGTRSLSGMRRVRGVLRRPWLRQRRETVRAALAEFGLAAWRDPHNDDPAYTRSRVRQSVLPVLERELGPGVVAALARTADLARADADALDEWAAAELRSLAGDEWPVAALAALPVAVRSRMLRSAILARGAAANDLTAGHVAAVDRLVIDWQGQGAVTLPGGVTARRRYGRLGITATGTRIGDADGAR